MKAYKEIKGKERTQIIIDASKIPTLFKYCSITDNNVNAFLHDEIWATSPNRFNDPYDSVFCHDKNEIIKYIQEKVIIGDITKYKAIFNTNNIKETVKKIYNDIIEKLDSSRNNYVVSCFSEKYNSEIMWAHYAGYAKGFVLEYSGIELYDLSLDFYRYTEELVKKTNYFGIDFSNVTQPTLTTIMPIIYTNTKYNATKKIKSMIDELFELYNGTDLNNQLEGLQKFLYNKVNKQDFDDSLLYSSLCNKRIEWKYEKEWRIWGYNINALLLNLSPYLCMGKLKAKALYLGEYISEYDRLALLTIANNKNIPVYQMQTKVNSDRCKLVKKKIL